MYVCVYVRPHYENFLCCDPTFEEEEPQTKLWQTFAVQ